MVNISPTDKFQITGAQVIEIFNALNRLPPSVVARLFVGLENSIDAQVNSKNKLSQTKTESTMTNLQEMAQATPEQIRAEIGNVFGFVPSEDPATFVQQLRDMNDYPKARTCYCIGLTLLDNLKSVKELNETVTDQESFYALVLQWDSEPSES